MLSSARKLLTLLLFWAAGALMSPALAQELLSNGSFELNVQTANGNNLGATVPGWTTLYEKNLVRPYNGYLPAGPNTTPTGGGSQYYDSNSNGATDSVSQAFTVSQAGMVDFSAWFSVRDSQQAATGTISIRQGSTVIASASISFAASDALGSWRRAASLKFPIAAGSYTFVITLPDPMNVDLASVFYYPSIAVSKSLSFYSDPVNGTTNPKAIPGSFVNYTIAVSSPSAYAIDANAINVIDATPAAMSFFLGDVGVAGGGPVRFTDGTPTSGRAYTYGGLSSTADGLDFSNNNGATWTYVPTPDANGVDAAVTHIRVRPTGTMAASRSFTLTVRYRIK